MKKFTADEVEKQAAISKKLGAAEWPYMQDLALRLRQEEEENRRDPVTNPRLGDRIEWTNNGAPCVLVCHGNMVRGEWSERAAGIMSRFVGATIIIRREVQQ